MSRTTSPLRDRELVRMLADEPELLAIADALVETQQERELETATRRRWKPLLVAAVVTAALAGTGIAIADGLGAFNGISAAQHPQTGADVIDPATRAYIEGGSSMPTPGGLQFDTARHLGQLPGGQNIYLIARSGANDNLCYFVGPPNPQWNCFSMLSRSHPTAVFAYAQSKPWTAVGITLDGVTAVSFDAAGQEVTVPVKGNLWTYTTDNSEALTAPMLRLTAHFADGTTVVDQCPMC